MATTKASQEEGIFDEHLYNIPKKLIKNTNKLLRAGDILISTANSLHLIGRATFIQEVKFPISFGAFMTLLRPNEHVIPFLLHKYLKTKRVMEYFRNNANTTTNISNLGYTVIKSFLTSANFIHKCSGSNSSRESLGTTLPHSC